MGNKLLELNNNFLEIGDSYFNNYGGSDYSKNYLKFTYSAEYILKRLSEAKIYPESILDGGCASGELVADFLKFGINALGVDNNKEILRNSVCPQHTFYGDIRSLNNFKENKFDIIYLNSLMYLHPQEILPTLKKIRNICNKAIFLCTPFLGQTNMKSDIYRKFLAKPSWWEKQFQEAGFKKFNKEIYLKI